MSYFWNIYFSTSAKSLKTQVQSMFHAETALLRIRCSLKILQIILSHRRQFAPDYYIKVSVGNSEPDSACVAKFNREMDCAFLIKDS